MAPDSSSAPRRLLSDLARRRLLVAMAWLFGGGILAHHWPLLRPLALALTTPLLILTNAAVLLAVFDDHRARRLRWWCLGAWVLTVMLEIIGVATGRVFGAYHYGPTLRGQVAGVPLLIGLNWVVLLLGALAVAAEIRFQLAGARRQPTTGTRTTIPRRLVTALLAATLLTAFDWVMEPVAVHLGYWAWAAWPQIPLQNYGAWFAIAVGLGLCFEAVGLSVRTRLAQYNFVIQLLFFVALRLLL